MTALPPDSDTASASPLDDPRLTAWALGEALPTEDALAVQQLLAEHPEAADWAEALRGEAGLLGDALRQDEDGLDDARLLQLRARIKHKRARRRGLRIPWLALTSVIVSVALALLAALVVMQLAEGQRQQHAPPSPDTAPVETQP